MSIDHLTTLVSHAKALPQQRRFEAIGYPPRKTPEPFDHIEYCAHALLSGALPVADTLLYVATAFAAYVEAKGKKTLDEAFKLRSKNKAGNPSKQRAAKNSRLSLLFDMACAIADDPSLSQAKAAEKVARDNDISGNLAETLTRDYKRHHCSQWVPLIPKINRGKIK